MLPRLSSVLIAASLVAFAAGALAVAYGRWSRPLVTAADALAHHDLPAALSAYGVSDRRFRRFPISAGMLPADHAHAIHNQLAVLYRTRQYDAVIEKAEDAPAAAAPHFWAGCALFAKTANEDTVEGKLVWLGRAEEEFKRALEAAPDDWDAKYNFEICARQAAALRREPRKKPSLAMPLLRPQPKAGRQPAKKAG